MKTQRVLRLSLIRRGQRSSLQLAPCVLRGLAFLVLFAARWAAASSTEPFDNPVKKLTLEQLGNVEVTSVSKEPEEVRNTSAAIYVITQEDIERSGVTNLPDALRLAPGVEGAQIDSSKWSIGIRGFGSRLSRDVLVLIDGRTVYTTLLAGTYWEVQNVMLDDVERIEVIRGPGGTIWGPNAVNGVINIITKNAKDTHGALVDAQAGSLHSGNLNARYGGHAKGLDHRIFGIGVGGGPQVHSGCKDFRVLAGNPGGLPHRLDKEYSRHFYGAG